MSIQAIIKDGNVHTYNIRQNTANYTLRIAHCPKGLWTCVQESYSQWKLTITNELIEQTVNKASGGKQTLSYKQFLTYLVGAVTKQSQAWSLGIMTPIQLDILKGGDGSKQANSNKLYLILSNKEKKLHYPFTLILSDMWQKDKLTQAIRKMKEQLQDLKKQRADKSQSSFSIMSETMNMQEQMKLQNQELKKKIKIYEQSLTQKRGAVEIDMILKEKNTLQIKAETKRRQQNKQITRLKNLHMLMERQTNEIRNQVDYINKQLMLLQDSMSNPAKLKTHALRVLKSYQTELRTSKKIITKQTRQLQNLKRNILNSKNHQKRHLGKIKQIQQQIQQLKKKANVKQISNRLHSNPGSRQGSSVASSNKAPSITSSQGKPKSYTSSRSGMSGNLVRQNLLKKTSDLSYNRNKNNLMKTSPNINTTGSPNPVRKSNQYKPPTRPVASSHQISKQPPNYMRSQLRSPAKSDKSSVRSAHSVQVKRKQFTPEEKERQRAAMQRLTGAGRRNSSKDKSQQKQPSLREKSQNRVSDNRRQTGSSLQSKPKFGQQSSNNAKDILKKMKEVKAHYSSKAIIHAENNKNLNAKIAQITQKK